MIQKISFEKKQLLFAKGLQWFVSSDGTMLLAQMQMWLLKDNWLLMKEQQ